MMPVFRVEKTADFTVMSNHHLRNRHLSLRAKGLLSQMLSLPPDWDYTLAGLAAINLEGIDAVREAVRELEKEGYVTRERKRDAGGRFSKSEYVIREYPRKESPILENPTLEKSALEIPTSDGPALGIPTELTIDQTNTEIINTDGNNYPINQIPEKLREADKMRRDREIYREIIKENIGYETFAQDYRNHEDVDEIIEIMLDAVCTSKPFVVISGEEMPKEVVKSRLLKLTSEHIQYVLDCTRENTTKVRNIKQYILACLYNAPATISNYYTALVRYDLYGGIK